MLIISSMSKRSIQYYFGLARDVANLTKYDKRDFLVGAVAVRRDGVIVAARNGISHQRSPRAHAETRVLQKAGVGAILFVVRISKTDGKFRMAKPCRFCQSLIQHKKVSKCYFTIDGDLFGEL